MNSSLSSPLISSQLAEERVEVPAKWRTGQIALISLVVLAAIWFMLAGYRSPQGDSGVADNRNLFDLAGFILMGVLIWLTTPPAATVAITTFHEAIRRRWMTALLGFTIVMLLLSTFFTWMQQGEEEKFLRDFGVGFIVIMTLITTVFLGVALIPPEIERRTIFTILSKPVTRLEFLLGKWLGLMVTLAFNLLIMGAMFLLSFAIFRIRREGGFDAAFHPSVVTIENQGLGFELTSLTRALLLNFGNISIIASLAIMFSLVAANMTAIVFSFLFYFAGQLGVYLKHLSGGSSNTFSPLVTSLIDGFYFFLPRLDQFEVRERLVNGLPIGINYLMKAGASSALYTAFLLCIAYLLFSDREF